jgi:hypothetical protein
VSRYQARELRDIPNHDGSDRARGDRFFSLPDDDDVGDLVSASTSSGPSHRWEWNLLNAAFAPLIGLLVLACSGGGGKGFHPAPWGYPAAIAVTAAFAWMWGPFLRCSYIGTDGVHQSWRTWRLIPRSRTLRFSDAVSCELVFTRVFGRRGYVGTNARAIWRNDRSRVVLDIEGGFREYRIDRDQTDLAALERLSPETPTCFVLASVSEFRRYQRWDAERELTA